jgi:hypothetical protein
LRKEEEELVTVYIKVMKGFEAEMEIIKEANAEALLSAISRAL